MKRARREKTRRRRQTRDTTTGGEKKTGAEGEKKQESVEELFRRLPHSLAVLVFGYNPSEVWELVLENRELKKAMEALPSPAVGKHHTLKRIIELYQLIIGDLRDHEVEEMEFPIRSFIDVDCLSSSKGREAKDFMCSLFTILTSHVIPRNILQILTQRHWYLGNLLMMNWKEPLSEQRRWIGQAGTEEDRIKLLEERDRREEETKVLWIYRLYYLLLKLGASPLGAIGIQKKMLKIEGYLPLAEGALREMIEDEDLPLRLRDRKIHAFFSDPVKILFEIASLSVSERSCGNEGCDHDRKEKEKRAARFGKLIPLLYELFEKLALVFEEKRVPVRRGIYRTVMKNKLTREIGEKLLMEKIPNLRHRVGGDPPHSPCSLASSRSASPAHSDRPASRRSNYSDD